jgi:uncharacterized membrane protein YphA (DoxX/SURF4 family)
MTTDATTTNLDVLPGNRAKSITRHFPTAARILLGLIFFVFGLNGFLNFLPEPSTPLPDRALAFFGALMKTGYMIPLIKGTEVVVGILLLANRFVPLALVVVAPVIVNIFLFDTLLAPVGAILASAILTLELYLAWAYRNAYRSLLAWRTTAA